MMRYELILYDSGSLKCSTTVGGMASVVNNNTQKET